MFVNMWTYLSTLCKYVQFDKGVGSSQWVIIEYFGDRPNVF